MDSTESFSSSSKISRLFFSSTDVEDKLGQLAETKVVLSGNNLNLTDRQTRDSAQLKPTNQ